MKKVLLETIQQKSAKEVTTDLEHCRYSLLNSLGCQKLRNEMIVPGQIICDVVRYYAHRARMFRGTVLWPLTTKKYLVDFLRRVGPHNLSGELPLGSDGMVIGFNHPSLGEIIRLVALVMDKFPHRRYLFPVNLPWYENLCPIAHELDELGVKIVPMITPATRKRILRITGRGQEALISELAMGFNFSYIELCKEYVMNGDIIVVAPSATRQRTVFKSPEEFNAEAKIEPPTMSLLASMLAKEAKYSDVKFVPIAIKPPKRFSSGLNLFTTYELGVCEPFALADAVKLSRQKYGECKGKKFDHDFLMALSLKLIDMNAPELVMPNY